MLCLRAVGGGSGSGEWDRALGFKPQLEASWYRGGLHAGNALWMLLSYSS